MAATSRGRAATIILVLALRSVSWGILGLVLPLYFASVGRTAGEWGLASGAFAFTTIFGEPLWGWAADRLGTAIPLAAAGLGSAFLVPIFALTGNLGVLIAVQLARGGFEVAGAPASRKALAGILGPGRKAAGIGLFQAASSAGNAFGPLLGGYVLGRWGFGWAFLLCAAASLVAAAVALANRTGLGGTEEMDGPAEPAGAPDGVATPRFPVGFVAVAAIAVCSFAGSSAGRSFVPLLGTEVLRLPASQVASVLAITGALGGPLTIVTGGLADRLGRRPLIASGLLAAVAGLVGYGVVHTWAGLVACALFLSLGFAAVVPAAVALVSDMTPPGRQGRMIGIYGACEDLGIMLGPLMCGFLWDAWSPRAAFMACAGLAALGIPVLLWMWQRRERWGLPWQARGAILCIQDAFRPVSLPLWPWGGRPGPRILPPGEGCSMT